jgi:valyl-tRNA synthetase
MIRKIEDKENQNIINYIYKQILILLHPFCPFITENIYQEIFKSKKSILDNIIPQSKKFNLDEEFFTNTFIDTVNICKDIRIKKSLKNSIILDLNLITEKTIDIEKLNNYLKNFSINIIKVVTLPTDNNKKLEKFSYGFLEFNNNFDTNQSNEKEKLIIFLKEEITRCEKILSNENFIKRANPEKVKLEQEKLEKYKNELKSLL